eukprot:15469984-Alexandrium_andersonii.AAC.1
MPPQSGLCWASVDGPGRIGVVALGVGPHDPSATSRRCSKQCAWRQAPSASLKQSRNCQSGR